jgi:hypothetical protein
MSDVIGGTEDAKKRCVAAFKALELAKMELLLAIEPYVETYGYCGPETREVMTSFQTGTVKAQLDKKQSKKLKLILQNAPIKAINLVLKSYPVSVPDDEDEG